MADYIDRRMAIDAVRSYYDECDEREESIEERIATTGGDAKSETTNPPKMTGWICPVCGRGLSPYTSMCPCKGYPKMEVTC